MILPKFSQSFYKKMPKFSQSCVKNDDFAEILTIFLWKNAEILTILWKNIFFRDYARSYSHSEKPNKFVFVLAY